jgi:hypothetical protein
MTNSQTGLVNLKTTYCNDPAMVAAIDVLVEQHTANCAELQTFVDKHEAINSTLTTTLDTRLTKTSESGLVFRETNPKNK